MGIPKFYRWLSERYPLVNQPIGSNAVPIIDNLYLDMNGIIHNCTHGNDPGTRLTEPEMIARIFTYLDRLFQIVQPQKLLFMAIDGVAPRAKMNQQRSRRFKSAREAQEAMEAAQRRGEPVPEGEVFDSNCITPGTAFMGRLGAHLRFFLRKKIAEDPAWQRPNIVFSGHDVPGEGEHKIMEYIRWQKLQPNYPPNLRHCMYGLDADLIMLSLVTHDPHFCLLREVVSFSGGARGRPAREVLENPSQEHFILFQIGLLRDYLTIEFRNTSLPFQFDTERIIDDFVLFCMLIGNDFLPALPTLDIAEGALDKIFGIYKQLLPAMGGYLTEAGALNRPRLELLLQKLAGLELEVLEQRAEDAEAFDNKRARRGGGEAWVGSRVAARRANELDEEDKFEAQLAALGLGDHPGEEDDLALLAKLEGDEHDERPQEPTMMSVEARRLMLAGEGHKGLELWKDRYYREKLRVDRNDPAGVHDVVHSYITGLHWVLDYYYRGVASWNWFYPYHFAPMVSDMVNIEALDVRFEYGKPFLPFDQLLAVLPSASCKLLPQAFEALMKDPQSPIIDFYPPTFRVDMEGKRSDWEGVVLIPFIDQERLLQAAASVAPSRLSAEERERNKLGDILIFSHDPKSDEQWYCASTLPTKFSSVVHCNSRCKREPPPPPLPRNMSGFVPRLVPGTKMGPGGPAGFPTLSTLSVTPQLKAAGVEVFGQPSKKESLILQIKDTLAAAMAAGNITAIQVADTICGQRCWIKWPYMQEAIVQAVSDKTQKVDKNAGIRKHDAAAADEWWTEASKLGREFVVKHGMDVGRCEIILHVRPVEGLIRQLDGSVEKRFSKKELLYPIQATLRRNPTPDPRFDPASVSAQLAGLEFGAGSKALFLGRQYYGCVATVLPGVGAGLSKKGQKLEKPASTTLHVEIDPAPVTAAQAAQTAKRLLSGGTLAVRYEASGQVARKLGVSARTLGRITSNVWLQTGEERVDVGIFVKHGSKSLCVPDYVQPAPGGSGWMYSEALCNVLSQYKKRHTWVFRMVEDQAEAKELDLAAALPEMTPDARIKVVSEAKAWLKTLPLMRRPLVKTSSQVAPEQAIRAAQAAAPPPSRPLPSIHLENVAPALLLPPAERGGVAMALAGGVFELGDRVASIRATGTPPFGLRGTVVGVHEDACEVLFDADFLGGNDLHGRCNGSCGLIIPADQLLNLSKPQAIQATGPSAPKVVRGASQAGAPTAAGAADSGLSAKQAADAALAGLRVANGAASGGAGAAGSAAFAGPVTGTGPVPPPLSAALKFSKAEAAKQGESSPARRQPAIPPAHGSKGFAAGRGRALAAPNGQAALEAAAPGSPAASPRAPTGALDQAQALFPDGAPPSRFADAGQQTPVGSGSQAAGFLRQLQQASLGAAASPAGAWSPAASPTKSAANSLLAQSQQGSSAATAAPRVPLVQQQPPGGASGIPSALAANPGQQLLHRLQQVGPPFQLPAPGVLSFGQPHAQQPGVPPVEEPHGAPNVRPQPQVLQPPQHVPQLGGQQLLSQLRQGHPQPSMPSMPPQNAAPSAAPSPQAAAGAALLQQLQQRGQGQAARPGQPRMPVGNAFLQQLKSAASGSQAAAPPPVLQPGGAAAAPRGVMAGQPVPNGQALLSALQQGSAARPAPGATCTGPPAQPLQQPPQQAQRAQQGQAMPPPHSPGAHFLQLLKQSAAPGSPSAQPSAAPAHAAPVPQPAQDSRPHTARDSRPQTARNSRPATTPQPPLEAPGGQSDAGKQLLQQLQSGSALTQPPPPQWPAAATGQAQPTPPPMQRPDGRAARQLQPRPLQRPDGLAAGSPAAAEAQPSGQSAQDGGRKLLQQLQGKGKGQGDVANQSMPKPAGAHGATGKPAGAREPADAGEHFLQLLQASAGPANKPAEAGAKRSAAGNAAEQAGSMPGTADTSQTPKGRQKSAARARRPSAPDGSAAGPSSAGDAAGNVSAPASEVAQVGSADAASGAARTAEDNRQGHTTGKAGKAAAGQLLDTGSPSAVSSVAGATLAAGAAVAASAALSTGVGSLAGAALATGAAIATGAALLTGTAAVSGPTITAAPQASAVDAARKQIDYPDEQTPGSGPRKQGQRKASGKAKATANGKAGKNSESEAGGAKAAPAGTVAAGDTATSALESIWVRLQQQHSGQGGQ